MSEPVAQARLHSKAAGPRLHYALVGGRGEAPRVCNAYRSKSCTDHSGIRPQLHAKSRDTACRVGTPLSHHQNLPLLQGFYGLKKRPRTSPASPEKTNARPNAGLREIMNRQPSSSRPSSSRSQNGIEFNFGVGLGMHQPRSIVHVKRSEERRVGKECRSRWSPSHKK